MFGGIIVSDCEEFKFGDVTICLPKKDIGAVWGKAKRMVDIFLEDGKGSPIVGGMRGKLSEDKIKQLKHLHEEGRKAKEIAEKLDISLNVVYKYLKHIDEDNYKPMLKNVIDTRVPKEDYAKVGNQ